MLRIHFTGADLGGVRMAAGPDPLWETILSFHRLRDRRGAPVFGEWRTETRVRLKGETRLLGALVPRRGYFPDFLTPAESRFGLAEGLEALRATPAAQVRTELALLASASAPGAARSTVSPAGAATSLADGTTDLGRLTGALRAYHRAAVEPYWPHIRARAEADRLIRVGRCSTAGRANSSPPCRR